MGIQLDDDQWKGWRSWWLNFLITPALVYLDIVCDIMGYQIDGEIKDMKP
jgi:hypothetical protein